MNVLALSRVLLVALTLTVLQSIQCAHAQGTLRGGVSTSEPSIKDIYRGQDPLKGKPEMAPPNSLGLCAPLVKGWILVWQSETTCYYFAPYPAPLQGRVITPDEAKKYHWDRCSAHPWDPTLIVCYGSPNIRPNGSGPGLPDFQVLKPGPAGGIGYTAGPDPCRPKGPGGYYYCNNGPGAWLPPGCHCGWGPGERPALHPLFPQTPNSTADNPPCSKPAKWKPGPVKNYFSPFDPHSYGLDFISDSRYITVAGHGAPGVGKLGSTPFPVGMVDAKTIARDIHEIRILPGNGTKGIRIAACESADANGASAPLAQQVADAYKALYHESVSIEGFEGCIQYDKPGGLDSFPCKVFTSR